MLKYDILVKVRYSNYFSKISKFSLIHFHAATDAIRLYYLRKKLLILEFSKLAYNKTENIQDLKGTS